VKISELDVTVYDDYATGVFVPQPEVASALASATQPRARGLYRKNKSHDRYVWGVSTTTPGSTA
jgi:hypothetical protein